MNTKKFPSCYIISETSLGIQCAELLLKENYHILAIISTDHDTAIWAVKNNITHIDSFKEFTRLCTENKNIEPFDYLFSIVNSYIIPIELLTLPRYYAINYHDAALPRYAGVHATSWAILNNEEKHGVSWHIIKPEVDSGNILSQIMFEIDANETALSLNLKCYTYALDGFKELIRNLVNGPISGIAQDLNNRSYFSLHQKPSCFGFAFFNCTAEEIYRKYRALKFGNYPNGLTSFKVLINQQIYIPNGLEILSVKSDFLPGTIVKIWAQKIQITTKTNDIILDNFTNLLHEQLTIQDIVSKTKIFVGYLLNRPSNKLLNLLKESSNKLSLGEKFWQKNLSNIYETQFNFIKNNAYGKLNLPNYKRQKHKLTTSYTWNFVDDLKKTQGQQAVPYTDLLIISFLVYLHKVCNSNQFTVGFVTNFLRSLSSNQKIIFPSYVHLNCNIEQNLISKNIIQYFLKEIRELEQNKAYFQDIFVRHPSLEAVKYKAQIVIHQGDYQQIIESLGEGILLFNVDYKTKTYGLYSKNLGAAEQVIFQEFPEHIVNILYQIVVMSEKKLDEILITTKEQQRILHTWNYTDKEYPDGRTIQDVFEEQVEKTPYNIAVIYEDLILTYKQLNERANQLAHYLRAIQKIKPDTLIALCLDRSDYVVVGVLGILKAGAGYVPLDPNYPDERISHILQDTKTCIVLTNAMYQAKLKKLSTSYAFESMNILGLENEAIQVQLDLQPITNPKITTTSTDLAHVIYTSGTTGKPKGVMIEHKSVISLVKEVTYINICPQDSFIQLANIAFDAATFEIWGALLNGAKLFVPSNKIDCFSDVDLLQSILCENKVSILWLTKTLFDRLYLMKENLFQGINYLLVGGEALNKELIQKLVCSSNAPKNIINGYGPTENTTFSCTLNINKDQIKVMETVPIGKPLTNRKAYVLDIHLNLVPVGIIGELYVGGVGLARGYLNRTDLTTERFIKNPFQSDEEKGHNKNSRLYKTGDLVRWLPNGNLEYIGRRDFQVKIRGYRIEMEEIEVILCSYKGVKQSVVLVKEQLSDVDNKYLIGYYIADSKLNETNIIKYLQSKLPDYMVPRVLIHLKTLPLTVNGKLDRKSLPEPTFISDNYIAPRNELEVLVQQIWANVLDLNTDKVSIDDDFFRLGGNSIIAIRLINKLNKELKISLKTAIVFKEKTIEKLAYYLKHISEENTIIPKISVKSEEQVLSFAQERLWFIEQYEGGSDSYNIPLVFKLCKDVQINLLEKSIRSIISRHEILRTLIKTDEKGNSYQWVINDNVYPLEIKEIDINRPYLNQSLSQEAYKIYDLSNEYPVRISFFKIKEIEKITDYYLSVVIHHIAFDGWSTDIFLTELQTYYSYYLNQSLGLKESIELPILSIQYKDFSLWQRSYLSGERLEKQLIYWKDKLKDYETLNLTTDKLRPTQINYSGSESYFTIDEEVSKNLRSLAKELKVSLYSVLLSGYYLMLRAYSNQDDIVIGTPVADRQYGQTEFLIGFFVNTLALRIKIDPEVALKTFIKQVAREVVTAQLHQDLPFEKLVEELKVAKDTSKHPIFQIMFGMQNFGNMSKLNNLLEIYPEGNFYNVAKFDLSTFIDDSEYQLKGSFNYATSLYEQETIKGFIDSYILILNQFSRLSDNKNAVIKDLYYLSIPQYQRIIYDWNAMDKDFSSNKTIHQLFEEQVEKTPHNTALIYERTTLTYKELNEKANRLAHYLRLNYNIKQETLVALCLYRSEQMLICILAILKAGGAYVPVDPSYPNERITYILEDTQTKLVITNELSKQRLEDFYSRELLEPINLLTMEDVATQQQLLLQPTKNLEINTESNNLAYVIYTSGTTGKPKGVMIEHKAYLATIEYIKCCYFTPEQKIRTYSITNYVFDIFGLEYGLPLLSGGLITIGNIDCDYIDGSDYDFVQMTPSLCNLKLDCLINTNNTKLFLGGESLNHQLLKDLLARSINVINVYGPTETTIWSTAKLYAPEHNQELLKVSLGKIFANEKSYVLDRHLNVLPIGAIGELYLGGVGLARGYLNQPTLTLEKFVQNPFQNDLERKQHKNTRLYKTGDLVRLLPNGDLEYIGRNDFQVKIKGYRIELTEIENILISYKGIKQSVVLVKEDKNVDVALNDNKYLIGYYVAEAELEEEEVLNYLANKLPIYMLPNALVYLKELPLTINGKLDRKALLEKSIKVEKLESNNDVIPNNEHEKALLSLWVKLLGKESIGVHDNFFDLGGHSLLLTRMHSQLPQYIKEKLSIVDLFQYSTIHKISKFLIKSLM